MFTVQQVAELLSVTDDHVLDLIRLGRLPAVNVGLGSRKPRWRISAESLEEFKLARTATAPPKCERRRRHATAVTEFF